MWRTLLAAAIVCAGTWAYGQKATETDDAAQKEIRALYLKDALEYRFNVDDHELKCEPQPIMSWQSPNDWSGDVFVWLKNGRPDVLGCILSGPTENSRRPFYHEFHALTRGRLPKHTMTNGRTWETTGPGVEFKPLDGAPPPSDNERQRLQQMRTISREFAGQIDFQDGTWELRLLTQPLFRYRRPENANPPVDWIDGALFGYVLTTGTDLEAVLVVEAAVVDKQPQWRYGFAQMTNRRAWMKHKEKEVWRIEVHGEPPIGAVLPYTTSFAGFRTVTGKPASTK